METFSHMMWYLLIKTTQIYIQVTQIKINKDIMNLAERIERKYELPENTTSQLSPK